MEYLIHLAIIFAIYAILGLSLNLVVGYTGLLSVAQAAFYGLGAYATAIFLVDYRFNFLLALILGMIVSAAAAFLIGLVLSRFAGDFYALVSIGFNVIIFSAFLNLQNITRGPLGIPGIPRPSFGGSGFQLSISNNFQFLILAAVFLILIYFAARFVTNSSFGRVLKAIREDEQAIQVFGYRAVYYKLAIFVMAAALASIAGSLFASYITFIDPSTFYITESIFILAIIILGGLADLRGSVIGALFLILLPELLRFVGFPDEIAAQMRQLAYGLLLIVLMLYRPQGLLGKFRL